MRSLIFRLGYRFRLHVSDLPGKPDLVFRGRKKLIFVHGCFWHGHKNCPKARLPKSNSVYWETKIATNRARDRRTSRKLATLGWTSLTIWTCELANAKVLASRIERFLGNSTETR